MQNTNLSAWLIIGSCGVVALLLFALITEGRYFGKGLLHWVYNRVGPSLFGTRSEAERWQALAQMLALHGDETLLDVGTAVGDLPLTLAALPDYHGRIVGVDWSPRMIAAAQAAAAQRDLAGRVQFRVADLRRGLPFAGAAFDGVFCLGVLEGMPQPAQILAELCRVLTPTGVLVLSLYRGKGTAVFRLSLSLDWYQKRLLPYGFQHIQRVAIGRHHDIIIARREHLTSQNDDDAK